MFDVLGILVWEREVQREKRGRQSGIVLGELAYKKQQDVRGKCGILWGCKESKGLLSQDLLVCGVWL